MQDPIDKARLLNQAYDTLCKRGEGWTLDMLADMKKLVLEAEEEEHIYTVKQEEYEAKASGYISEQDMEDMSNYYENKGTNK